MSQSCMYGLKTPTRCVAAVHAAPASDDTNTADATLASNDQPQWLIGTYSSTEPNEIHHIAYNEQSNTCTAVAVYSHPQGEIRHLTTCPFNPLWYATVHYNHSTNQYGATVSALQLNAASGDSLTPIAAIVVAELPVPSSQTIVATAWNHIGSDSGQSNKRYLAVITDSELHVFTLSTTSSTLELSVHATLSLSLPATAVTFDAHQSNHVIIAVGGNIIGYEIAADGKQLSETFRIPIAHKGQTIRAVDCNPNRSRIIASGGDDRCIRIWDYRQPEQPLRLLAAHTHWIWNVAYNRVYDQLLLSAGTELVNLWSVTSVSSASELQLEQPTEQNGNDGRTDDSNTQSSSTGDKLVKTYKDEHEDSIYCVSWSHVDAWIFVSLSFDGRVVINHVAEDEKYKLLL